MSKTLFLPAIVMVAASALIGGSYSALAGSGPVSDVAGAIFSSQDGDEPEIVTDVEIPNDDGEAVGAMENAEAIAEALEVDAEEVMTLHEEGIGFGALLKLYQLAKATGVTVEELLASIEEDGGGYAFGKRFNELSEEELAELDGIPTNLGQLKKALRESQDGDGALGLEVASANGAGSNGHGPPEHAKAHGKS